MCASHQSVQRAAVHASLGLALACNHRQLLRFCGLVLSSNSRFVNLVSEPMANGYYVPEYLFFMPGIKVRTAFFNRTLIPGINKSGGGGCETDFKHTFNVQKATFSLVL